MSLLIKLISITTLIVTVQSLELLSDSKNDESDFLRKIVEAAQRRVNKENLERVRTLFLRLTKKMEPREVKRWLRQEDEVLMDREPMGERGDDGGDQQASIIEEELQGALRQKQSALLDRPYVEQKGKNDFLVMRPDVVDPFVTVIPNAMYYNIEKKCVNWLDDCSLKGIRARLLNRMESPFK